MEASCMWWLSPANFFLCNQNVEYLYYLIINLELLGRLQPPTNSISMNVTSTEVSSLPTRLHTKPATNLDVCGRPPVQTNINFPGMSCTYLRRFHGADTRKKLGYNSLSNQIRGCPVIDPGPVVRKPSPPDCLRVTRSPTVPHFAPRTPTDGAPNGAPLPGVRAYRRFGERCCETTIILKNVWYKTFGTIV